MSKTILAFAAFVAANVLMYLACAFIVWEFDPSQWNPDGRFVFVLFGVMCGALAAFAVKESK